jgi:hypothetical protein
MTDSNVSALALLEQLEKGELTKEQVLSQLSVARSRGFELGHTGTKCDSNGTLRDKMTVYGGRSQGRPMEFNDAEWSVIADHFAEIQQWRQDKLPELRAKAQADFATEQAEASEEKK